MQSGMSCCWPTSTDVLMWHGPGSIALTRLYIIVCRSFGGMYVIGLAYRGTANNAAVQKLLHFAVADVSDDVRRAAVLCLGFVLMGVPEQCPRIVALLAESYNPHLRYGAPLASVSVSSKAAGVLENSLILKSCPGEPCSGRRDRGR